MATHKGDVIHYFSWILRKVEQRDETVDPHYTVHLPNAEAHRLRQQLLHLGPKLGWYIRRHSIDPDIVATMPERDLEEVERLVQEPAGWTLEATLRSPKKRADAGGLINVSIDIDGHHGRTMYPLLVIGAGAAGLVATLTMLLVMLLIAWDSKQNSRG